MAVSTTVIVEGAVTRVSRRHFDANEKRGALDFVNVLVVGDHTLADCTLGRDVSEPPIGTVITAEATVSTFRDEDQITITRYIERKGGK